MNYEEIEVSDEYLCGAAFTKDGTPDLLVAAAWAINGYRCSINNWHQTEPEEDFDDAD